MTNPDKENVTVDWSNFFQLFCSFKNFYYKRLGGGRVNTQDANLGNFSSKYPTIFKTLRHTKKKYWRSLYGNKILEILQKPRITENEMLVYILSSLLNLFSQGKKKFSCSRTSGEYRKEPMEDSHEIAPTLQCNLSVCIIPEISPDLFIVTPEHTQHTFLNYLLLLAWDPCIYLIGFFEGSGYNLFHSFIHLFM